METDSVYQQKIPMDLTTATNVRNIAMYAEAKHYIIGLSSQKGFLWWWWFFCLFFLGGGIPFFIHLHFHMSLDVNAVGTLGRPVQSHCQVISLLVLL